MKVLVTGGAGHVGSRLCLRLTELGHKVVAYDNLMLGRREFLGPLAKHSGFQFIENDLLKDPHLDDVVQGSDFVYHLAANSDISQSGGRTDLDLEFGIMATYRLLESMRRTGTKQIVFSSSSAIYGEAKKKPTPEGYGPLEPISLYGASKLSAEAYISAFAHHFGMTAWIYRFANIVGPNLTHGAIFDFIAKLKRDPSRLEVLGDGSQKKSYLHVDDCVSGMIEGTLKASARVNFLNLTAEGVSEVKKIAHWVVDAMKLKSQIHYTGGDRGWVGDVPYTWLDHDEMFRMGWRPRLSSDEAVRSAIRENLQVVGP